MKFLKSLLFFALILLLASCSEESVASTGSTYPDTEIVGEEPAVVGHIVEVLEEKQIIVVVEGIRKEEALVITATNFYQVCHLIYHLVPFALPRFVTLFTKTTTKPYRPRVISLQGFLLCLRH